MLKEVDNGNILELCQSFFRSADIILINSGINDVKCFETDVFSSKAPNAMYPDRENEQRRPVSNRKIATIPALLTTTSILPKNASALSATFLRSSRGAVTSSSRISAPAALSSSNWASERARAVAITLSPRAKASSASCLPRPDLASVRPNVHCKEG